MPALSRLIAPAAFLLAALLASLAAVWMANAAERLTRDELMRAFYAERLEWVVAEVDGLGAHLTGTAPNEGARLAALRVAAGVIGSGRLSDDIEVPRRTAIVAPVFRIEAMRNGDDISLIGLVPLSMGEDAIVSRLSELSDQAEVADMLQTADHPEPPGWGAAVDFAIAALRRLSVGQVSVSAGRIEVHALVDSPQARLSLTNELRALAPRGQVLVLDLVAPRPVIAPFLLRMTRDEGGARLEACAADTEAAREAIERAARLAGITGRFSCTVGLGAPSPRWAQAAERAMVGLTRLGAGTVTLSDGTVLLQAPHDVDPAVFDRVVGALESDLPAAFSLTAVILPPPDTQAVVETVRPDFRVVLTDEGLVTVTGRLPDVMIRQAVATYARARFGSGAVTVETRLDPDLPQGWTVRVLAGLEALTELHHGNLVVTADRIEVTGVSGNPDANSQITRLITARLGGSQGLGLRVNYDERLDPVAQEPTPERCEAWAREILAGRKITFAPGSARLDSTSSAILDDLAEVLRNCGELPFEVAGHTDSQGRAETNMALSQSRAEAVVAALSARGVLVASMTAQGYGADRPIADNGTESGREANRRIEIALLRQAPDLAEVDEAGRAELEAALVFEARTPVADQTRPAPRPARGD
jgi:OmpA-OmpF porin, OOP family